MSFTAWAHSHARSILFLLAALAIAGAVASLSMPVALFPQVSFPRVRITLDAGDRPAEQMTIEVTTPVEEAVRAIPGVRNLRSTTSRGTAEISVNFNWGEDMISAMLQCQSQVNKILPSLPSGTSFEVERMDPTGLPGDCLQSDFEFAFAGRAARPGALHFASRAFDGVKESRESASKADGSRSTGSLSIQTNCNLSK